MKANIKFLVDEKNGVLYYSVVDVLRLIVDDKADKIWNDLKELLKRDGCDLLEKCRREEIENDLGELYEEEFLNRLELLRVIESLPIYIVEPLKIWLANLGDERLNEILHPELAFARGIEYFENKGFSKEEIEDYFNSELNKEKINKKIMDDKRDIFLDCFNNIIFEIQKVQDNIKN